MTYIVGLTGGIGSGKTVVSDHFAALGVPVIDTDVVARQVVEPGKPALAQLAEAFGNEILQNDGTLDRNKLRAIAFASDQNKHTLDTITHPAIRVETIAQISSVSYPYCIVVVPLLTADSPFNSFTQRVLVVTANHQTKIKRVQKRSNLSEEEVLSIMQTQLSDTQRREFADEVIENDGSIQDAQQQVEELHQYYLELSIIRDP